MDADTARGIAYGHHDRLGVEVLGLLTRGEDERFELHMLRIAHAPGPAGEVARAIELAELDDLLARSAADPLRWDLPPYAWARRHIAGATDGPWRPS